MNQNNIAHNLNRLMQNKNINCLDLANALSISPELIINIKNGTIKNPGINAVANISKYFFISIEKLMYDNIQIIY